MRRVLLVLAATLLAAASSARADESPHHMALPDGTLDPADCPVCHKPDMSLERSPLETCTLCHAETSHAGSIEHLRVPAAAVRAALAGRAADATALPVGPDGMMHCYTCHLYHDPGVLGEAWLEAGWVPADAGLAGAVRRGIARRWSALEKAHDQGEDAALFSTKGTRLLRLPVADGTLCKQCHGSVR